VVDVLGLHLPADDADFYSRRPVADQRRNRQWNLIGWKWQPVCVSGSSRHFRGQWLDHLSRRAAPAQATSAGNHREPRRSWRRPITPYSCGRGFPSYVLDDPRSHEIWPQGHRGDPELTWSPADAGLHL